MEENRIHVFFLNNTGAGFAGDRTVNVENTLGSFLRVEMGESFDPSRYYVRVNREIASASQVLVEGDHIIVSPKNIKGAK